MRMRAFYFRTVSSLKKKKKKEKKNKRYLSLNTICTVQKAIKLLQVLRIYLRLIANVQMNIPVLSHHL